MKFDELKKKLESELIQIHQRGRKKRLIGDVIVLIILLIAIWYMGRDLYRDGQLDYIIEFLK